MFKLHPLLHSCHFLLYFLFSAGGFKFQYILSATFPFYPCFLSDPFLMYFSSSHSAPDYLFFLYCPLLLIFFSLTLVCIFCLPFVHCLSSSTLQLSSYAVPHLHIISSSSFSHFFLVFCSAFRLFFLCFFIILILVYVLLLFSCSTVLYIIHGM